ncbi:MAG: hypothetical protein ABIS17_11465 [Casimicrobiaceae bacterium]
MPICEIDPWRVQYFAGVRCPDDVRIPTEDSDAWAWNPVHRWVYDRIMIAASQGIPAGPHGTAPPAFPVFSKPIVNLKGMGLGARTIASPAEYERLHTPGHMWTTLLQGDHLSTDVAVVAGEPRWWCHAHGLPAAGGTFDYWIVGVAPETGLRLRLHAWIRAHLAGYTGMVNLETIGGMIIEVHLRLTDQWPDLYGNDWITAVVDLYARGRWLLPEQRRLAGFSVALFGPPSRYRHPPPSLVDALLGTPGVSSVQIAFHEDRDPQLHAQPSGGFRLAVINCRELDSGLAARARLRSYFHELAD